MMDDKIIESIFGDSLVDFIPDKEQRDCFQKFCYLIAKAIFDGVQEAQAKFKEVEHEEKNN